jgi:hypothetical protein
MTLFSTAEVLEHYNRLKDNEWQTGEVLERDICGYCVKVLHICLA